MAEGIAVAYADAFLDSLGDSWIQFHIGAPGPAGTSNPAVETRRTLCSFAAPAAGVMASDAAVTLTNVPATEDWTHFTAWTTDAPGGSFKFSGAVTGDSVNAGDTANIAAGALTATFPVAS